MTNEQFPPLSPGPEQPHQDAIRLSPSEEFALAHPELVDATPKTREVPDPNARRERQLRGVGGGLAAAVAGELSFNNQETTDTDETAETVTPVKITSTTPVQVSTPSSKKRPIKEPRSGDSERDTGEPLYYGEPQIPTDEEKVLGKAAIQAIRKQYFDNENE